MKLNPSTHTSTCVAILASALALSAGTAAAAIGDPFGSEELINWPPVPMVKLAIVQGGCTEPDKPIKGLLWQISAEANQCMSTKVLGHDPQELPIPVGPPPYVLAKHEVYLDWKLEDHGGQKGGSVGGGYRYTW